MKSLAISILAGHIPLPEERFFLKLLPRRGCQGADAEPRLPGGLEAMDLSQAKPQNGHWGRFGEPLGEVSRGQ